MAAETMKVKRILVVDDDRDSTDMMALLLESFGHQVETANDGLVALERTAAFQPHVVLLDINLPTMTGHEVARRIRTEPGFQPLLVALTGWGQDEDRLTSLAAGFDLHMVKPINYDQLTKAIADFSVAGLP